MTALILLSLSSSSSDLCINYIVANKHSIFLQIDGVPGLAVTLFGLLLELHKCEQMARNSVDEAVCKVIRQYMHD